MSITETNGTSFLFLNQTTDGNSSPLAIQFGNKVAVVKVWGTFAGASIKLQSLAPQTSPAVWIDIPDINGNVMNFTGNGQRTLRYIVPNEQVRAVQSGSAGGTTLNVSLELT